MYADKPKDLLIIVNGFDLACGLESSFKNYFDYIKKQTLIKTMENEEVQEHNIMDYVHDFLNMRAYVQNNENIDSKLDNPMIRFIYDICVNDDTIRISNYPLVTEHKSNGSIGSLFDVYFLTNEILNNNWSDVETNLYNLINNNDNNLNYLILVMKHLKVLKDNLYDKKSKYSAFINNSKKRTNIVNELDYSCKDGSLTLLFIMLMTFEYPIDSYSDREFVNFIFNQLNQFERNLGEYIGSIENDSYRKNAKNLLKRINKNIYNNRSFNILDFNYTNPFSEDSTIDNVHGDTSQPIIGVDANSIRNDDYFYKFSKTYRIMTRSTDNKELILPDDPKNIYFYGHSLAPADYSYFQTIFDHYDIYNSSIKLVFCYSIYDSNKENKIKSNYFEEVYKLMNTYGESTGTQKGRNILHKMILEGRLMLKEIDTSDLKNIESANTKE
ncbi:AbiH family protein [Fructilactobacillus fructivorans]|uniref:AbiH family protein n=1 Tax=Fructilactobacillus fructivorans TaxID=1614 RepID=UPI000710AC19|nr:AbiH family protein [Fructilactobacillus fructivorans]KRN41409.1 hypothetical protein IV51_GL000735 [Fructilactobacillus fructivorans]